MVNGLLVPPGVFQEVGVVVVDFGIVRQSLDTRAEKQEEEEGDKEGEDTCVKSLQAQKVFQGHEGLRPHWDWIHVSGGGGGIFTALVSDFNLHLSNNHSHGDLLFVFSFISSVWTFSTDKTEVAISSSCLPINVQLSLHYFT